MQAALDGSKEIAFTILSMTRVAGRGVHPGAVHGRHRRPAAARVRGHDRRRDPGVGLRLDQPDADAVQPLPEAAARAEARPVLQRDRADLRRAGCGSTTGTLRGALRFQRGDDGGVGRCCSSARSTCSRIVPKGFLPSEDQGRFNVSTEAVQGIGFDEMVAPPAAGRRDRRARTRTSLAFSSNVGGGPRGGAMNTGQHARSS